MDGSKSSFLDALDRRLIDALRINARATNRALANLLKLSASATLARLRKLERRGIILGYTVLIAQHVEQVGQSYFIEVELDASGPERDRKFEALLSASPEVTSAVRVSGRYDYLIRMTSASLTDWRGVAAAAQNLGIAIRHARITNIVEAVKGHMAV